VVTAGHVVRFSPFTAVRLSRTEGSVDDWPVPGWIFHDDGETDVAVAPILLDKGRYRFNVMEMELEVDEGRPRPRLGETIYFVGLLANVKSMHHQNVPMVRSGTLGRLYQDDVLVRWPDKSIHSIAAHLIDCRSHQGFSGSPCYVQLEPRGRSDMGATGADTYLLGLITGHLDELGADRSITNSGVGIVTPVEDIWHVLMQRELVEHREGQDEQFWRDHPEVIPAVMDAVPDEPPSVQ
jgi:hypothetical protein